mmetsp:Transcript_39749/g.48416  ORF Transcript_39749/g.48416 Transcript_39749/m.48416 type:complete len:88 (+) Transcript_39749:468-731(+)
MISHSPPNTLNKNVSNVSSSPIDDDDDPTNILPTSGDQPDMSSAGTNNSITGPMITPLPIDIDTDSRQSFFPPNFALVMTTPLPIVY